MLEISSKEEVFLTWQKSYIQFRFLLQMQN